MLAGFYKVSDQALYGTLTFRVMTNEQLDELVTAGVELINQLYPPPPSKTFLQVALPVVMIALAIASAGAAIGALAGVGQATAVAAQGIASVSGAAGGISSVSAVLTTVQNVATVINSVSTIAQVTGHSVPERLAKVSGYLSADINKLTVNTAIEKGFDYILEKQNQKIDKKNQRVVGALRERIDRERLRYAEFVRQMAAEEAKRLNMPPPEQLVAQQQQSRFTGKELLLLAVPLLLS